MRDSITRHNYIRRGHMRVMHGVYGATPEVSDPFDRRTAVFWGGLRAAMTLYPNALPYGATALQAWGVALPERLQEWETIHLLTSEWSARPRRPEIAAHTTRNMPPTIKILKGARLAHPVIALTQVHKATDDELVEIADGLLRRQNPLMTLSELESQVEHMKGLHGTARVRKILPLVVAGTDSIMETRTRLILIRAHLPEPTVNLPVNCPHTNTTYHMDLGYDEQKVAVEYDGAVHVGDRTQMEIDAHRRRNLQDLGWILITITNRDLKHPDDVIRSVENALNRHHR
ncbi:MAG: endonuclease domain-containing protein [Propionibacteriaceae bacterium]|nr:endonuclease domain-containing protein [Propionibacteriaceae bacterium]